MAARHLDATPGLIGISGIGGLLGAMLAPRLVRTIPAGWLNITGLWMSGVLIALLALVPSAVLLAPIIAVIAVISPVLAVISGSTAPLGLLLTGFLLSGLGAPATCAVLGIGLLLVATAATASPTIRHSDLPATAPS